MSYEIKQKVGKHIYLYLVEGYRDKNGKPRQRRRSIGKIDPATGQKIYKPEYLEELLVHKNGDAAIPQDNCSTSSSYPISASANHFPRRPFSSGIALLRKSPFIIKSFGFGINVLPFSFSATWERDTEQKSCSMPYNETSARVHILFTNTDHHIVSSRILAEMLQQYRLIVTASIEKDTESRNAGTPENTLEFQRIMNADLCILLIDSEAELKNQLHAQWELIQNAGKAYWIIPDSPSLLNNITGSIAGELIAGDGMGIRACSNQESSTDSSSRCESIMIDPDMDACEFSRSLLDDVQLCSKYFLRLITEGSSIEYSKDIIPTNPFQSKTISVRADFISLDSWGEQFLDILFKGESIRRFNTELFLKSLEGLQSMDLHHVVKIRWKAIQAYYSGNEKQALYSLQEALQYARSHNLPLWLIDDILIDMRNRQIAYSYHHSEKLNNSAQEELDQRQEVLYYPVLDRIDKDQYGEYIDQFYKLSVQSPYTVSLGENFEANAKSLAQSLIVAMYYGSLTHLHLCYARLKNSLYFYSCKFGDGFLRINLLKYILFLGDKGEAAEYLKSHPDVLNSITATDAVNLMNFSKCKPLESERILCILRAFGAIGYYLPDEDFSGYMEIILSKTHDWLDGKWDSYPFGFNILDCLSKVCLRIPQDNLADICCSYLAHHYTGWYTELFRFMNHAIDIRKMSMQKAQQLIQQITLSLSDPDQRKQFSGIPMFLCTLRKQNRALTEGLNKAIQKYLPDFYSNTYSLETTTQKSVDLPVHLERYLNSIAHENAVQGQNGAYTYGQDYAGTVRNLLLDDQGKYSDDLLDKTVSIMQQTIMKSRQTDSEKASAVSVLICIVLKYPDTWRRNSSIIQDICNSYPVLVCSSDSDIFSSWSTAAYHFSLQMLSAAIGSFHLWEFSSSLAEADEAAEAIAIAKIIDDYLQDKVDANLPPAIEAIILQKILQWEQADQQDLRYKAVAIMIKLYRKPDYRKSIESSLIQIAARDDSYIKALILRSLDAMPDLPSEIREEIIKKCKNSTNFVIREMAKP